jgi:hypothetical protein
MKNADTYREAMRLILECGPECDAKAFAFAQAASFHEHGNTQEAIRWAEIANAVDVLLQDSPGPAMIPAGVH